MIDIYTDGACRGNPGPGGYGVIVKQNGDIKTFAQGYRKTTNNRMELLAVIIALEALPEGGQIVTVYSDSKYVVDAIEKGWLKNWLKIDFKAKKILIYGSVFGWSIKSTLFIFVGLGDMQATVRMNIVIALLSQAVMGIC